MCPHVKVAEGQVHTELASGAAGVGVTVSGLHLYCHTLQWSVQWLCGTPSEATQSYITIALVCGNDIHVCNSVHDSSIDNPWEQCVASIHNSSTVN